MNIHSTQEDPMTAQIVLITGATSGIGRHAALHLAARGHHVIATGRRTDALEALKREAGSARLDVLRLDVTDAASIAHARQRVDELTGGHGLDVLVNNAGYGQAGAVLDVPDERVRAQFETNVFGLLAVTRAFVGPMIARGRGRVVNVSSIGGRIAMPLGGVYTATKFAVESLSDAMRVELGPLGVHVALIEPGAINTRFNDTMVGSADGVNRSGPWEAVYDRSDAVVARFEATAPGPLPVSRAITRAIESRWPRARYVAPRWYGLLVYVATRLPAFVVDTFFARAFGFSAVTRTERSTLAAA
jgi:NAD(P)-dependent dehydrogenase (short-subunit alcohol dehydrogenase family)